MATMKDLALKIHQRTSRYTNLNQQIQDNAGNINTNISKISTIESQVQELQDKANALRGYKEYNANEAYSVGDIIEAEGLFKVIKAITAEEEHPQLSDPEYFVNLTYTLDDLDALISRLDTELGSLAEIAGQIEFDTIELGGNTYPLVMNISPQIAFTASKNGTNINFFSNSSGFNTSDYDVYINRNKTSQAFNSLTFNANDRIQIKANKEVTYFPYFYADQLDYIQSIDHPFPTMSIDNTTEIASFENCFNGCNKLISIPQDLFKYNTNVTGFSYCFFGCTSLTSIPQDLFKYNPNATDFMCCFGGCSSLTSIPQDLFKYNPQAISFWDSFNGCSNVTSAVPELWVSHPNADSARCFRGCTSASNYSSIPRHWR